MSVCRDHIYVIKAGDLVKVGSATDPHKRRSDLQTGNGNALTLEMYIGTCMSGVMRRIEERVIHAALKRWRTRGDWFSCGPHVAIGCVLDATQHIADRKIFCVAPSSRRTVDQCLDIISGADEWSCSYEFMGLDPPWPKNAFWWFSDTDCNGVVRFTWMDREMMRPPRAKC